MLVSKFLFDEESFFNSLRLNQEEKDGVQQDCCALINDLENSGTRISVSFNPEVTREIWINEINIHRKQNFIYFDGITIDKRKIATTKVPVSLFHKFAKDMKVSFQDIRYAARYPEDLQEVFNKENERCNLHWEYCEKLIEYFEKGDLKMNPMSEYVWKNLQDPTRLFWRTLTTLLANYTYPNKEELTASLNKPG